MKTLFARAGFSKRSGHPIHEVVNALVLWVWLQKESIGMFVRESLQSSTGKDVGGEMIKRELDIKSLYKHIVRKAWRKIPEHSY